MPKLEIEKVIDVSNFIINKDIYIARGKKQFPAQKIFLEKKPKNIYQVKFNDIIYYVLNLEEYLKIRETKGPSKNYNKYSETEFDKIAKELEKWVGKKFDNKNIEELKNNIKNILEE